MYVRNPQDKGFKNRDLNPKLNTFHICLVEIFFPPPTTMHKNYNYNLSLAQISPSLFNISKCSNIPSPLPESMSGAVACALPVLLDHTVPRSHPITTAKLLSVQTSISGSIYPPAQPVISYPTNMNIE